MSVPCTICIINFRLLLVDMLAFANDHPPPATIILIAGDRDYAYAVSTLRLRQYNVVLIVPPAPNIPQSLESQASVVVDWNYAILGKDAEAGTSPIRQPYRNLDEDIVERLSRQIRDLNEDPVITLISSSVPTPPTNIQHDIAVKQQQPSMMERNADLGHAAQPASSCTPKKAGSTIPTTPVLFKFGSVASRARSATKSTQTLPDLDRGLDHSLKTSDALSELSDNSPTDDFTSIADENQDASHDPFAIAPNASSGPEHNHSIVEPDLTPTTGLRNAPLSPFPAIPYNLDPQSAALGSPSQTRIISGGTPVSYGKTPQNSVHSVVPLSQSANVDPTSAMLDNHIVMSDKAAIKDALGYSNRDGGYNNSTDELAEVSIISLLLNKANDPSHAQVANSTESHHTMGNAYNVNSTLANDSPPTHEPPAIPISPTSSSAPSPSTPSTPSSLRSSASSIASDSNVKMGSQQATSVVTNNKDKSSGCQAPAIDFESVEDKIRHLTPPVFLPLINQLLLARSKGIPNPSRSDIANDLVRVDKDVYKRARATKFADYALLAKEASLIEFGGGTTRSNSWVTLHSRFRQELDAPKSSAPSSSNNPLTPQNNTSCGPTSSTSTAPTLPSSTAPQETTKLAALNPSPPPVVSIPPCFQPLINCLSKIHKNGLVKPFPSTVGLVIGPEIYSKAGASSLAEYFDQAVEAGVVQCGGNSGHAWVSLHPDVLSGKRSC
ncbi:uncharacterized protein EDB93DRAFT_457287 [Suillus bovinus]|uniref:uncharacterized protein n=1 Tax=Suillus bovinus TaxID=48563 RepID=UPI001B861385|nr:uncharacterized protein EDB93DRAFT_457287 [Suillus bovinus]KAG2146932.1 hypothetical protein EDB93DRAFT_457287 [Suillus bovinus]